MRYIFSRFQVLVLCMLLSQVAYADESEDGSLHMLETIESLQKEIDELKQSFADGKSLDVKADDEQQIEPKESENRAIHVGGALRFQYNNGSFDNNKKSRYGDIDFDIFRLDLSGQYEGIIFDVQWRWYQYMTSLHHAWVGYQFAEHSQVNAGLILIPFGNQAFNSQNYFLSSNYYVGLEDSYALGLSYSFSGESWSWQTAFLKNDANGGIVSGSPENNYTFTAVGVGELKDDTDDIDRMGLANALANRLAYSYQLGENSSLELGGSAIIGGLYDSKRRIGHYEAYALHGNLQHQRWQFQLQAVHYDYQADNAREQVLVAAYGAYDAIASRANIYTANIAYHLPVNWGAISGLDFYNNYSLVSHKAANLAETYMNVTGVGVSAGKLYTYFDWVTAKNQPFIGGSMAGDDAHKHRFNINVGYYF